MIILCGYLYSSPISVNQEFTYLYIKFGGSHWKFILHDA